VAFVEKAEDDDNALARIDIVNEEVACATEKQFASAGFRRKSLAESRVTCERFSCVA
jgi:hypothetical protein